MAVAAVDPVDDIPPASPAAAVAAAADAAGEDAVGPLATEAAGDSAARDGATNGRVSPTRQRVVGQQRPSLPSKRVKRTTNQLLWMQHKLMPRLLDHPQSFAFHRPVVEQIPALVDSYPKAIAKPMDFSLVQQLLGDRDYAAASEAIADLRLVFENCRAFNKPSVSVVKYGNNVEKFMMYVRAAPPHTRTLAHFAGSTPPLLLLLLLLLFSPLFPPFFWGRGERGVERF